MAPGRASGWLRPLGVVTGALALTLFFVVLGFPYDRLAARGLARLDALPGIEVRTAGLRSRLGWLGPGVEGSGVEIDYRGGQLAFDRLFVRPAWSTSWLTGTPSVYVDAEGPGGGIEGALRLGEAGAFDGRLLDFDLASPIVRNAVPQLAPDGRLDADAAIELTDEGPLGDAEFTARDFSLAVPGMPMALPFRTGAARMTFAGGGILRIESLEAVGPLLDARVSGEVGKIGSGRPPSLDLEVALTAHDPDVAQWLRGLGTRVDEDGNASLRVTGTLSRPFARGLE